MLHYNIVILFKILVQMEDQYTLFCLGYLLIFFSANFLIIRQPSLEVLFVYLIANGILICKKINFLITVLSTEEEYQPSNHKEICFLTQTLTSTIMHLLEGEVST